MLEFNQALTDALAGANTKAEWSAIFIAGLGPTRRMRALRNGVAFADVALTGAMASAGGNITGFGKTGDATVQLAADLMAGTSVLRFEGNGNYVQGTLGLTADAQIAYHLAAGKTLAEAQALVVVYDFTLPSNPTTTSGIALSSVATIRAPGLMPSGTGPAAPPPDANSITAFRVITYNADETVATPSAAVPIDVREPDMVMERPYMAREIGDVRVMRVADGAGIIIGTGGDCYRFAATMLSMNAVVNSEANAPLHQGEVRCKPHGRWASYPFKKDLNTAVDTLIPPAHKIEWLKGSPGNYTVAHVTEMYSTRVNDVPGTGWPVNSFRLKQDRAIAPVQAYWTCGMVHPYQSHRPKMHSLAQHFVSPIRADDIYHPKNVSEFPSQPQAWPLITGSQTFNGLGAWRVAPKWSRKLDTGCDTTIIDTGWGQIARDNYTTQVIGYGHEPAASGHHTIYGGYGGPRHDRGPFPNPMVRWISTPNGTRIHGAVPLRDMAHHWMMNYFNHHQHFYTDLERGLGIAKSKVLNGEICYNDTFYRGSNENFRPDIENNAVRILAATNKNDSGPLDKNGRRFTSEHNRDLLHSSSNAAIGAYIGCSAMHVRGASHSFISHVLASFDLTQYFNRNQFLTRQHCWFEKAFAEMWVVANNSPAGFTSNEIETMWGRHLERVYDSVYPSYASGTDMYSVTLRNLGVGSEAALGDGNILVNFYEDSKSGYMGQVLMFMKQTGSWDVMRARSSKCAAVLDMIVDCMAKCTVGVFLDANGVGIDKWGYNPRAAVSTAATQSYESLNAALSDWGKVFPPNGQMDWIRGTDGVIGSENNGYGIDATNTMHYRAQTLFILKTFGFVSGARIDAAIAKVDGWYSQVAAAVAAGTVGQFGHRFVMMGIHSAPDYVGAPV